MARPLYIDGKLPMKMFRNKGYIYAVTRTSVKKENGKYNHPMEIWGRIDDETNFYPNEKFWNLSQEKRDEILIPKTWNIIPQEDAKPLSFRNPSTEDGCNCTNLLYGENYFLDLLSEKIHLKNDLQLTFNDKETTNKLLTLAFYNLFNSNPYNGLEFAQKNIWFPSETILRPCDITRLTQSISEEHIKRFLELRKSHYDDKEWFCIDTTSITYLGDSLAEAHFGKNKEHDKGKQINLLIVYSISTGLPVFYRKLPGNIPDTRTMRVTLELLKRLGFEKLKLVFDRGFVSDEVLEYLIKNNHKFIMMVKTGTKQIANKIKELGFSGLNNPDNWLNDSNLFGHDYPFSFNITVKGKKRAVKNLRMGIFHSPARYSNASSRINGNIADSRIILTEACKDKRALSSEDYDTANKYFKITTSKNNVIKSFSLKEEAQDEILNDSCFSIITNIAKKDLSLNMVLETYDCRNQQEDSFMFIKSEQGGRRLRASTEDGADGRIFIQFLSLILNSLIFKTYKESPVLQKLFTSRKNILAELRSIRRIAYPKKAVIVTDIVGSQVDIFREFKLAVPTKLLPKSIRKSYFKSIQEEK